MIIILVALKIEQRDIYSKKHALTFTKIVVVTHLVTDNFSADMA